MTEDRRKPECEEPPVFIGGTNGSGTRVYAQLLEAAGVFQGATKNYAFEPEAIIQYTRPLVPELMRATGGATYDLGALPSADREKTERWLRAFADQVQAEKPEGFRQWGWKHPRNLYLTPFLDAVFPRCFFVQVVRDGRDMGLAGNKGDFQALNAMFGTVFEDTPAGAAGFWASVNTEVANWADAHFGPRYVCSRFEDLCAAPRAEIQRVLRTVGLAVTPDVEIQCTEFVRKPDTVGRWHSLAAAEQAAVYAAAEVGLRRFGYI